RPRRPHRQSPTGRHPESRRRLCAVPDRRRGCLTQYPRRRLRGSEAREGSLSRLATAQAGTHLGQWLARWRNALATYGMLVNWTEQGMRQGEGSPGRLDTAKRVLKEMGGEIKSFFMTMGDYDMVAIYEAPDDAVAARFTLMLGALGNVRSTTLKAFPEAAYREIVASLA